MEDFIKVFMESIDSNSKQEVFKTLEKLYFEVEHKGQKLREIEEYKIAYDILEIKNMLHGKTKSLLHLKLKSKTIKSTEIYNEFKEIQKLDDGNISVLREQLLNRFEYTISSVFLLNLIQKDQRKDKRRYILATVISLIGASAAISVLLIKEIFFN